MSPAIWHDLHSMDGAGVCDGVSLVWGAATDVGLVRSVNEDSLLASPPVFVVADGMGGHAAGDVASSIAVDMFRALAEKGIPSSEEVISELDLINREVVARGALGDDPGRAMGTTTAGIALVGNGHLRSWMVFNVGDSRIYRSSTGRTELLSVDHSLVQELVADGRIDAAAARHHPQRNVVTRAMGVRDVLDADVWLRTPVRGERYMVCSDGLSSEVDPGVIERLLEAPEAPGVTARMLVEAALAAGGRDNVSVIVIDVLEVVREDDLGDAAVTAPRGVPTVESASVAPGPADGSSEIIDGVPTEWNDRPSTGETGDREDADMAWESDG